MLDEAGIKFRGEYEGLRIHDWRHTFCVNSLQKMKECNIPLTRPCPCSSDIWGISFSRYFVLLMSILPLEILAKFRIILVRYKLDFLSYLKNLTKMVLPSIQYTLPCLRGITFGRIL